MKIALVAPVEETVPPKKYGGTEWIVYYLAHYLGEKKHEVDLYTAGDSNEQPYYDKIVVADQSLRSVPEFSENLKLRETAKWTSLVKTVQLLQQQKYDIIHNHASWRFLIFASMFTTPIVTTHHGPLSLDYQNYVFSTYKHLPYVSISNNQRKDLPDLNFVATIYNGTDVNMFPYPKEESKDSYEHMIFLARMSDEKGALEAAQTAVKTKKKLHVGAKVDKINEEYFNKFKPYIDNPFVTFQGEMNHDQRLDFLQKARCLLAPIKWEEPFGLMFTEAMSSGTPVVAFSRGSAPEIVKDGVTGLLVNQSEQYIRGNWIIKKTGIDGLCEAVERIYSMPQDQYIQMRRACRKHVEDNFTVEKMVDNYEKVYLQILKSAS